ncbi:MAG: T9SS type A sorting domain-containing protein [Flavobacteriales bacterium]
MKHILTIVALLLGSSAPAQYPAGSGTGPQQHGPMRGAHPLPAAAHVAHPDPGSRGSAPINDDCTDAITLTVHPYGSCPDSSTAGDNTDATHNINEPTCDNPESSLQDVWYTFTTGAEYSVIITLTPDSDMTDWRVGIYDGCGGNGVYCIAQPIGGNVFPLLPNTTYWLSVWTNNDYGTTGAFELCVEAGPPPPPNDLCSSVVPQPMGVGDTWAFTGDATGATNTEEVAWNSVWHAVTLTGPADLTIDFCGSAAYDLWGNFYRTIYLTCPPNITDRVWAGSYNTTTCTDGRLTLCYAKLAAGTYYLPVAPPIEPGDGYIMNVRADAFGSHAPSNDECAGALPLNVGALCNPVNYLPECATQSLPAIDCGIEGANANDDVWYSFTAPDNLVTLAVFAHTYDHSPVIDVYSGACGALAPYDCVDAAAEDSVAQLTLIGLSQGETYYFRVYNGFGTTPLDNASYELCVVEGEEVIIGVQEGVFAEGGGLYPNPSNGDFTLHVGARSTAVSLSVIDMTGRWVIAQRSIVTNGQVSVEGAGALVPGIYIVRSDDGVTTTDHRLVVQDR